MQLHVFEESKSLSNALAAWIISYISDTLSAQERFSLVLSGGGTPKLLYQLLAAPPLSEKIPWNKIDFFWGDERDVPYADDRNNAKMAFETLLDHIPVSPSQIYRMRTDIAPEQASADYEQKLKTYFNNAQSGFDLVLLGMGEDGHTLSLFPGTNVVHEEAKWVDAFYLPQQSMYRITLTKTIVNRSRSIIFLATGSAKATALFEVLHGKYNPDLFPSQEIKPVNGSVHWFVDKAAAARLPDQ